MHPQHIQSSMYLIDLTIMTYKNARLKKLFSIGLIYHLMHKSAKPVVAEDDLNREDFCPTSGVQYGITINPQDELQYFDKQTRIHMCRDLLKKDLFKLPKGVLIDLETELSLPNSNKYAFSTRVSNYPRIHFHGIIFFKTDRSVIDYLTVGPYLLRNYSINICNINDMNGWVDYCRKQNLKPFFDSIRIKCMGPDAVYVEDNKVFKVEDCWVHNSDSETASEEF